MSSAPDSVGSRDVDQRVEVVDDGHSVPSPRSTAQPWLTGYLTDYWNAHPEDTPVPAGVVVLHALQGPPGTSTPYIDLSLDLGEVAAWGPSRPVRDHLLVLRERWDATVSPVITVVRVVLGLALDPELGRLLLGTGAIESVVRLWTPRPREGREPTLLPWDMLSDKGRSEAEEQPLLAAALGAPSEWNGGKRIALPG